MRSIPKMLLGGVLALGPIVALFIAAVVHMTEADHMMEGWSFIAFFAGLTLVVAAGATGTRLVVTAIEESDRR